MDVAGFAFANLLQLGLVRVIDVVANLVRVPGESDETGAVSQVAGGAG